MKKFKTKVGLGPLYRPFASLCAVSLAALGFLGGALQIRAASIDTWVGNTDANFSTVANWTYSSGSGPAASGDSWVFGAAGTAGTTLTDDVGTGTSFNVTNITFNAGAPAYTILNNGFVNNYTLRGNITNNSTSLQTINDVITLAGSRTVLTTAGGGNVTFGNCIKSSTLIVAGAGTVTLSGNTTDNANLNPDVQTNATCVLAKTLAGIGAAANATVENGGTLRLGAGNGREIYILTTINSGGVFDLNGFGEGTNSQGGAYIKVAGTGISSGGALVNNNTTSIGTYTKPVSLTGNTSMGGAGYLNLLGSVTNGSSYSITHAGAGILRLAGTNSYSGGTVCSVGTVQFGKTNSMPASGTVAISGATLAVNVGGSGEWTTNASGNGTIAGLLAGLGGQSGSVVTWTGNCSLGLDTSSDAFGLTYSGNIADLSSPLGFVKLGANTLTLSGNNTYSGSTTVSGGTLALTPAFKGTGAVSVSDVCGLAVSLSAPGTTLPLSSLTLGNTGNTTLQFINPASTTVPALTATNLTANGSVLFTFAFTSSPILSPGQYPLIKYTGSIGGNGFAAFKANYRYFGSATLSNNIANSSVDLVVTSTNPVPDVWTGNISGNWDTTTTNWTVAGIASAYADADPVQFDDTAATSSVNISTAVSPAIVVVTNNAQNYTFTGNAIAGSGSLVKKGVGMLTMSTTSKNTFTGGVTVSGGTLQAGNANQAFGSSANVVVVTNGGTVDFNGYSYITQSKFVISGTGVGGLGALVNNGANFQYICSNVVLAADATVGGTERLDMNPSGATTNTPSGAVMLDLQGHTLTCAGTQFSVFHGLITGGNINVMTNMELCLRAGTIWTNAGSRLTLGPGTTLWAPNNGNTLDITVPIYANGAIISPFVQGDADYFSPLILGANTTNTLAAGGTAYPVRQWAPISGTGQLLIGGGGPVFLFATNTYTASTVITNATTLALTNTGSINNTPLISILSGATLDVSGLASSTYNLSASTALEAEGISGSPATINGAVGGTVNLGSQPISLAYDGTDPALTISQGTLQLNGNAFTVNGAVLANGTYVIAQQASGSISSSGSYPTVTGTAIGAGQVGAINVSGGNVNLVVSSAPSVPPGFPANAVSVNSGVVSLSVTGAVGAPFSLWATTNLALSPITNTWTKLTNGTVSASPFTITDPGATTNRQRFYIFSSP